MHCLTSCTHSLEFYFYEASQCLKEVFRLQDFLNGWISWTQLMTSWAQNEGDIHRFLWGWELEGSTDWRLFTVTQEWIKVSQTHVPICWSECFKWNCNTIIFTHQVFPEIIIYWPDYYLEYSINCFGLKMENLKYLVMSTLSDIQWISKRSTGPTHIHSENLKLDNLSFKNRELL